MATGLFSRSLISVTSQNMNPRMVVRSAIPILASESDPLPVKGALPTAYEFVLGRALGTGTGDKHSISQVSDIDSGSPQI